MARKGESNQRPATKAGPKGRPGSAQRARSPRRKREDTPTPGPFGRAIRFLVLGIFGLIWRILWRIGLVGAAIVAAATGWFYLGLPSSDALYDGRGSGSVTLLDREGNVFAWRGEQYGGDLRVEEVSPHLVHAIVAAEDRRYWHHPGLDPIGIARAFYANYRAGRLVQGGSTLTQQVAKNVFLSAERSLERKLKEVPMALALELKYSKAEILSIYLNRVYLGAGTFGFEAASQRYFGKSARLVSPAEAAMLAGLLRAPSRYAPTRDLERAQGRASVIVRAMHDQGYLTDTQVFEALTQPARLSSAAEARAGGYFADWVLESAPGYLGSDTTEDVTIATTFDPKIQRMAEEALAAVFEEKVREDSVAQAAIVVMTPDGAVRAIVGGHEGGVGRFNRATQALRQTGSAFKPIVYAAALSDGLSPNDIIEDAPVTIGEWSPSNYSNTYRGRVTLTEALSSSINTVAVRLSERIGQDKVRALAGRMGVGAKLAPGPAVALGTSEATLLEMTGVYATIANRGAHRTPYAIREVRLRGSDQALIAAPDHSGDQVLPREVAERLTWMMRGVVTEGTGRRAQLSDRQVAGKTGTTQAARDAWFIGFTADYVVGVWMGNDDNTPLVGVTGGGLPADIWREVAVRIHQEKPPRALPMRGPGDGATYLVDGESGRGTGGTVVERVLRDVLVGLTGEGGGSQRDTDFEPFGAGDR